MSKRGEKIQAEVLAALRRRRGPLSACDVLGELREANPKIAPPTIYRALSALTECSRDHGLTSLAPQGLNTDSEASAQDVARPIEQMRDEGVSAVLVENINDSRLPEQIANETGATIGGTLHPSALSGPDGPAPTYLDMMRHNATTRAQALSS